MLGLIAGEGAFPIEIARAVRRAGRPVHAVAFPEITDPGLADTVSSIDWLPLGAVGALISSLREAGAREIVLAGKVAKTHLHRPGVPVAPDALAFDLLGSLDDRADARLLSALADLLEREGFALEPQAGWLPGWLAGAGRLGQVAPDPSHLADMQLGLPVARALADLDVGQCVAVEAGTVLAVEAIEGTDAAIERAGKLGAGHAVLVKVARPVQDLRLDCPAVGPRTLEAMAQAGFEMLAIEAGRTIVIGGEACLARADQLGIAMWGIEAAGLSSRGSRRSSEVPRRSPHGETTE